MFAPVQFSPEVESLVRFIEETQPEVIIEATLSKLREGLTARDLLTATSLAVVRSTELPPQHHGGPIHPISGVRAIYEISNRLSGELKFLPLIQHATLVNNHVHSPMMGPYMMPAMAPIAGSAQAVGTYHMSDEAFHGDPEEMTPLTRADNPVDATKEAFARSLQTRQAPMAEHHFLYLLKHLSPGEALDQLLPLAISGNLLDDHNFLYPIYTARTADIIGWEWASTIFRPAVRYQARARLGLRVQSKISFEEIEAIVDEHDLATRVLAQKSSSAESNTIRELGERMGATREYSENVLALARALRDGLSLEGAGEALSYGAALAYLSTSYGNPMDAHLHTGTNNRRYLLKLAGVSQRNRVLALLTGFTGPEVLLAESLINWQANLSADVTAKLPHRNQEQLLDALEESIESQPWIDWRTIGVSNCVAPDEVKQTVALARQYANLNYSAEAYFKRLAEFSCKDDFTELHAVKHFQAIVDEYYSSREELRWVHLVSAAKSAAVIHVGKEHRVYQQTRPLLAA